MIKRLFDLLLLLMMLPVVLPVFVLTYLAVWANLGSPVFFSQERGGYKGSRFRLWKFRSMTDMRDAEGNLLPDADRVMPFGRILRATSLDEVPCLWNLARGDISIVGPRPLIARYLPLYTLQQRRRHDVRPGITGWAQVKGRNALSWEQKFTLDIWYVEHCSFLLDIWIMLLTVWCVLTMRGVAAQGHVTMPAFTGSVPEKRELKAGG